MFQIFLKLARVELLAEADLRLEGEIKLARTTRDKMQRG
jgi:hypothetical protein